MKINADNKLANLAPAAPATERRAGPAPRSSPAAEPSAQVVLSPAAQLASSALAKEPGIDAEKVARMSQAIADGSFQVNADAIADKLIANAREQLAKAYGKTGEL
jgi:negative regulator of flagellin synthesis FlgM